VAFDPVLRRALEKDPSDRYASVDEMMTALEAAHARMSAAKPPSPKVLVFARDGSLRRSLVRNTMNTLRARGRDLHCDTAESVSEAAALLGSSDFAVVVLDEESADGQVADLIRAAHARNAAADLVIVSRDLSALTRELGNSPVRHVVPKPINAHVLAAVLGRISLVAAAGR
jgi:DNA-binding NtrC family response regulator